MGGFFSKSFDPSTELLDLKGRVVIVTGANTGIGFGTVKHLARRGATVHLGARNESKATAAIAQLEAEGLGPGFGTVKWLNLDLTDPRKAKAAAQEFVKKETRLDVLVNNAGGVLAGTGKTADGIQETMMVNYISPYIFTDTLIPLLTETAKMENSDVRIVNVSTDGHKYAPSDVRFRNIDDFNNAFENNRMPFLSKLGLAKLANILHIKSLQKRFDLQGLPITCLSVNPGEVKTEGVRKLVSQFPFVIQPIFNLYMSTTFNSPEVGAYNSVFAAASPIVKEQSELYKGAYLAPVGKITQPSPQALDEGLATELRESTDNIQKALGVL